MPHSRDFEGFPHITHNEACQHYLHNIFSFRCLLMVSTATTLTV